MKEELNEKKVNPIDTIARREEEQTNDHQDMLVNHSDKADEIIYKAELKTDSDWINSKTMLLSEQAVLSDALLRKTYTFLEKCASRCS